jgi:hypothetical protein
VAAGRPVRTREDRADEKLDAWFEIGESRSGFTRLNLALTEEY